MASDLGRIIFGGSFNPLHIGHMRLAIEALESLGLLAGWLDFVPAGRPPHKNNSQLLPFGMRAEMIEAAIKPFARMVCNKLEQFGAGPTYTIDTMLRLKELYGNQELYFLIGSQDYKLLPTWHKGLDLPGICSIVVAPRGDFHKRDFMDLTTQMWSGAKMDKGEAEAVRRAGVACMRNPGDFPIYYLPLRFLDISASYVRQVWLDGDSVDFLVPAPVLSSMKKNKKSIQLCWQENEQQC